MGRTWAESYGPARADSCVLFAFGLYAGSLLPAGVRCLISDCNSKFNY